MYEIKLGENAIGTTKFEYGDPPRGFVHGKFNPNEIYSAKEAYENLVVVSMGADKNLDCVSVIIEDYSEAMGEQEIQVTAQLSSAEEYEKYFSHHRKKYDASF